MATIVQQARDPWWANLAVNVLGGLWNDLQQRDANKKANAFWGELMRQLQPTNNDTQQSGGLLANPAQADTGQGLLSTNTPSGDNSNGWASAFHQASNPLAQYDRGVTGLLGANPAPITAQPVTTTPVAPAVSAQGNGGLPTAMDIYRAAMGLAATKRFAMMNPDTIQKMITPYITMNENARTEQKRDDFVRDYTSAADNVGRKNAAIGAFGRQLIDNAGLTNLLGANALTQANMDLGGSILPGTYDSWTGQTTYGDALNKSLTPYEAANIAQQDATRRENARQFDATLSYNREGRAWEQGYKDRQQMLESQKPIGQPFTGNDGYQYVMLNNGSFVRPSEVPGLTATQKEIMTRKENEYKYWTKKREELESTRRVIISKGEDTTNIDKQITEADTKINGLQEEMSGILNSLNTHDDSVAGSIAGQKMTISVNYETLKNNYNKYKTIIDDNAKKHNVDPELITAIIQVESNWKPHAVSGAGARGMMQLMPKTARYVGVNDSYDAAQNIAGGTKYIAEMLRRYDGNIEKALWAYNAGPGNADKGRMPKETRAYIANVMGIYSQLMGWRDTPELKANTFVGVNPYDSEEFAMATLEGRRKAAILAYQNPDTGKTLNQLQLELLEREADKGTGRYKNREELYNTLRDEGYVKVDNSSVGNPQSQTPPTPQTPQTGNNDKFSIVEPPSAQVVDPLDMRPSYMRVNMPYARSYTRYPGEIPSINPSSSISFVRPQTPTPASVPSNATVASNSTPFVNPLGSGDILAGQGGLTTPSVQENAQIQEAMDLLNDQYNTWDEAYRQRYPFASMSEFWGV